MHSTKLVDKAGGDILHVSKRKPLVLSYDLLESLFEGSGRQQLDVHPVKRVYLPFPSFRRVHFLSVFQLQVAEFLSHFVSLQPHSVYLLFSVHYLCVCLPQNVLRLSHHFLVRDEPTLLVLYALEQVFDVNLRNFECLLDSVD